MTPNPILFQYGQLEGTTLTRHGAQSEAIPLLWIGGWSIDPYFHPFGPPSTQLGSRILPIDLTASRSVDEFVSIVAETIADLRTEVDIAAWSMGALLAGKVQTMCASRVRRMVLCGAAPRFTRDRASGWKDGFAPSTIRSMKRRLPIQREKVLADFHQVMLGAGESWARPDFPPHPHRAAGRFPQPNGVFTPGTSPWSTEALCAGLEVLETLDLRSLLPDVQAPTLVMHGTEDLICPLHVGRYLSERLVSAEWIEVRGAGHMPYFLQDSKIRRRMEVFLS